MKKAVLFFSFIGFCFTIVSQNQICVDGSFSGTPNGTPSNPYKTIQAAINAAANGDIIKVAKGTYTEAVTISQKKVQLLGGFAGNGNFNAVDTAANKTIINGTNAAPCILVQFFDTEFPGTLIISGFTIRNGQRGIKLADENAKLVLKDVTIENNIIENNGLKDDKQDGGGIGFGGKNVTIRNNVFRNNQSGRGAAIGRISNPVDFLIADNRILNNTGYSDHAGGVFLTGTGTVTRNIFDGNRVAHPENYGWGGAIMMANYDTTKVITLSHNIYRNNRAPSSGGAVFVDEYTKVKMDHELFYNNTSESNGSAIYVDVCLNHNPSVLYMENCTVAGNSTDTPGGAAMYVDGSHAYVQNCIFWNNGSDILAEDDVEVTYNEETWEVIKTELLSAAILKVTYTLTQQGFTGTGNIMSDPLFANAAAGDFHLKSTAGRFDPSTGQFVNDGVNSPAIDAGNPASVFSNEPSPNGGRVNLGCYGNTAEASKSAGTGIEEITQILWTIFPNPAKESITISHLPSGSSVNIIDIAGKKVYSCSAIKNEQTTISTADFENGVYIIQVTNNGAVAYRKLVVSK